MNERELKFRFWQAFRSGAIRNNEDYVFPTARDNIELRVIEEGYFRAFDLVIAAITRHSPVGTHSDGSTLGTRTELYYKTALDQKCRIDQLELFPIELKSDDDVLDARLARQILSALYTFGNSTVVLDQKQTRKARRSGPWKVLPSTIVGYLGDNLFEIISTPGTLPACSVFRFDKRALEKLVSSSGRKLGGDKLARRVNTLQTIIQKMAFCQFYGSAEAGLDELELDFLSTVLQCKALPSQQSLARLKEETSNRRLTEFFNI